MVISHLNVAYLKVMKEQLTATLQSNAEFSPVPEKNPHVLQRGDGSVYTATVDLWTYDLAKAKLFYCDGQKPDRTRLLPVSAARDRIMSVLFEQLRDIDDAAAGREKQNIYHRRVI